MLAGWIIVSPIQFYIQKKEKKEKKKFLYISLYVTSFSHDSTIILCKIHILWEWWDPNTMIRMLHISYIYEIFFRIETIIEPINFIYF